MSGLVKLHAMVTAKLKDLTGTKGVINLRFQLIQYSMEYTSYTDTAKLGFAYGKGRNSYPKLFLSLLNHR